MIRIIFDDMIADMISNKHLNQMVTELFIRGRKLNTSAVFITQYFFKVSKNVRLNGTHYENFRQTRALTKRNLSFIRYWISRLYKYLQRMYCKAIYKYLQRMYCKTILSLSDWYYSYIR